MRAGAVVVLSLLAACGSVSSTDSGAGGGSSGQDAGRGGGSVGGGTAGTGGGTAGAFCSPCVGSADCAAGSLCLGGTNPRCGQNCAASGVCPNALVCTSINSGKMSLGQSCVPSDAACGTHTVGEGLSCTDTWANYGSDFIANTWIGACHRHDAAWPSALEVRATADTFRIAVERGDMPVGSTLTLAERRRLLTWLACGAP